MEKKINKTENNNITRKLKIENRKLKSEIDNITKQLVESKTETNNFLIKIEQLKDEITKNSIEFKTKLADKANLANEMLHEKIIENDTKFKKELQYAKKYAIEDHALELINVVSQYELALSYKPTDEKLLNYQKGFVIFLTMFKKILQSFNIEIIQPKLGQEYDSNIMECFEVIKSNDYANDQICQVINVGYKLHEHILKPALVKVCKK